MTLCLQEAGQNRIFPSSRFDGQPFQKIELHFSDLFCGRFFEYVLYLTFPTDLEHECNIFSVLVAAGEFL